MESSRLSQSRFSTPIKNTVVENLEDDKLYILKRLHYLFIFYASRASRYAYKEINEKCFMELMEDTFAEKQVRVHKNGQLWKNIVMLYHSKGKKTGMQYEAFLKVLPAVSRLLSRCETAQKQLKCLLKHLIMVYDSKVAKHIKNRYVEFPRELKKDTIEYVQKLGQNLFTIYKIYFPQEVSNIASNSENPLDDCFQRLLLFFKEFEVFPKVATASSLYLIFMEIITTPDDQFSLSESHSKIMKTPTFQFQKFVEVLVRVATASVGKLRQVQDPEWWTQHQKECLKSLLEYMESVRIKVKNSRFQNIRFSFIVYQQYINSKQRWQDFQINSFTELPPNKADFFKMFQNMKL